MLIDYLILAAYAGILFLLSPLVGPLFQKSAAQAEIFGLFLLVIPVFLYFFLFEASRLHATPGKLLMRIKVAKAGGGCPSLGNVFLRNLVKFIPWEFAHFSIWQQLFPDSLSYSAALGLLIAANILGVLELTVPLFDKQARAIHDYAGRTEIMSY